MEQIENCLAKLSLNDEKQYIEIANNIRNKNDNKQKCIDEKDTLKKCLLCKYYLSSNEWSLIIEKHIKQLFQIGKKVNHISGDGCFKSILNVEIKVSLGTDDGTFHFVQIRPDHDIHYYILLAFDIKQDKYGKLYWFLCESEKLYELLPTFGCYAHGTVGKLGMITEDNIKGRNCEYALRPSPYKNGKPSILWKTLTDSFLCTQEHIAKVLSDKIDEN